MRTVYCDFCHAVLTDVAFDCPADDVAYDAPRVSVDGTGPLLEGSIGSWIACAGCAECVRVGELAGRQHLLSRALVGNYGTLMVAADVVDDLSGLLDSFWKASRGEPVEIGAAQIALIASDPETIREERS